MADKLMYIPSDNKHKITHSVDYNIWTLNLMLQPLKSSQSCWDKENLL